MKGVTHKQLVAAKKREREVRKLFRYPQGFGRLADERTITEDLRRMALQEKR